MIVPVPPLVIKVITSPFRGPEVPISVAMQEVEDPTVSMAGLHPTLTVVAAYAGEVEPSATTSHAPQSARRRVALLILKDLSRRWLTRIFAPIF